MRKIILFFVNTILLDLSHEVEAQKIVVVLIFQFPFDNQLKLFYVKSIKENEFAALYFAR